jgi:hypothetical protein
MAYRDQPAPILKLGCLPAAAFGVVVGLPAAFGALVGECVDQSGSVGNCPNEGWSLLLIITVVGSLCALITWVTNRVVGLLKQRGQFAAWGVATGFALAAALVLMLNYVVMALG